MVVSALIYQSSALFYVVPLAAALIVQRHRSLAQTARWAGMHLGFVVATLGLAYCVMSTLYAAGVFVKSGRIAFEHHWGEKIAWFLQEPLPNALSLFVLNDNNHRDHALYFGCAAIVGAILLAGACIEWRRYGRSRGIVWLAALMGLPVFAFAVSSDRLGTLCDLSHHPGDDRGAALFSGRLHSGADGKLGTRAAAGCWPPSSFRWRS
jgi:hypothetical protein